MNGRRHSGRYMMIGRWISLASIFFPTIALADDVDAGREIARREANDVAADILSLAK